MPGGSANMDLSTYKSWVARKDAMRKRVVEMTPSPMPPKGAGALTQDELMAVSAWLDTVP
jgi:cell division FtsZ-interacting protein ZapD